jgi:ubiquinone/menaquinone biosynthesis C-methylase UbiE
MTTTTGMLQTIDTYWDERSSTYSASVQNELACNVRQAWKDIFTEQIPGFGERPLRVLDIGCGPGFFSIMCAQAGCLVNAVDYSSEMLLQAQHNVQSDETAYARICFQRGDAQDLPFMDASFDVIVTRNVTWNLEDPQHAYHEWHRLLKPGGRLLNFDANWYLYLSDSARNTRRLYDQRDSAILHEDATCQATEGQCARCEKIALGLPLTQVERPAWDIRALKNAHFAQMHADCTIWQRVWTPGEKAYYASSPLFMVVGIKEG